MNRQLFIDAGTFLGKVWELAKPYWKSDEKGRAWALLVAIVALTLGLVYVDVLFNEWNRVFYNALEQKNYQDFKDLLLWFSFLAVLFIAGAIYKLYLTQMLTMRWRAWLTNQYLQEWLDKQIYYRLQLDAHGTDNPDQRIAEDLRLFTAGTLQLGFGILSSVVTLLSFMAILWAVSGPITLMGITIPGYMLWAAVIYAIVGSVLTHFVGRPLIGLNFQQERLEADFRFNLVRLRENAEGVALYRGEDTEGKSLGTRFERIRLNWWGLMHYTRKLTGFQSGYSQIAIIFPFIVAAPRYFSGVITLGQVMQIASAFGSVQNALSWFVNSYDNLASWKASVDRLLTFQSALDKTAEEVDRHEGVQVQETPAPGNIHSQGLQLALPNGQPLLSGASFAIAPAERVLLTGPSGSGKSTLFRAIAGIWPYGEGSVEVPAGASRLFLPQKPYIPVGTLRDAVSFPEPAGKFSDEDINKALDDCQLSPFKSRLDEMQNWSLTLSGGEQQRLALARALLHKPDYLFLDEATSAQDEPTEAHLYTMLKQRLPNTAIVSIAHRSTVAAFHARKLALVQEGGATRLADGSAAQPA
ncbi:MAG TPA: ABC transporter ATP-binding protein/permease [Burkholderiales bacterium]|nr:ABC transporter ATP-binding protein/permease [Burkholderiales bacterium]